MPIKLATSVKIQYLPCLRLSKKYTILLFLGACIVFSSLFAAKENDPLSIVSPVSGVYVHLGQQEEMSVANAGEIANIGFIVGESSVMVIDPGGNPTQGMQLFRAIRDVTDLPISHIVLTHFHPDHVFGGKSFFTLGKFVAHHRYPLAMAQRADFYRERFSHLGISGEGGLVEPDILVSSRLEIDLGNRVMSLIAYKTAHTDHDLAVLDSSTGTLWASDLLFVERIPSLDGSVLGWRDVLKNILANKNIQLIIPGHGAPSTPEKAISSQLNYLNKIIEETRVALKQNIGLAEATTIIASDERDKWLLFDLQHAGNVTKAYTELEWE